MGIVSNLKFCPFCGGKGALEPHFYEGYDEDDNLCELVDYFVQCTKCGVSTPFMSCEESAQDAWEERYVGKMPPVEDGPTGTLMFAEQTNVLGAAEDRVPTGEAVQVCCRECRHLERVNGRIVDARCRMTNISFLKRFGCGKNCESISSGKEREERSCDAPIDPSKFYCAFYDCASGKQGAVHIPPIPPVLIGEKRFCVWYQEGEGESIDEYEVCGLKLWKGKWYALSECGEEFQCGTRDCLDSRERGQQLLKELKKTADIDI